MEAYVNRKSPKGGSETDFSVYRDKIQFQSNKVCYKVSLCENFHRQSCTAINQLYEITENMDGRCLLPPEILA